MEWRMNDDGRRMIGVHWSTPKDEFRLDGPSEAVEAEDMTDVLIAETADQEDTELILRLSNGRRPDELLVHAGGVMTAKALVDAVHDLWTVCRALCKEAGITVPELLKLVGLCDKENRRRGQAKRRLEVRAADMVE